jgi:hypothetical protein
MYVNDPELMAGCVFYTGGQLTFFPVDTVIQPDNPHPIPHSYLTQCHDNQSLTVLGQMPADFHPQVRTAIQSSIRLSQARKNNWLSRIGP